VTKIKKKNKRRNWNKQTPVTSYSSEEGVVAGHSRQFTPGGLPDNCETHCESNKKPSCR